jgi:SAM-dependent methyltransferase
MEISEAAGFLRPAGDIFSGVWADIGAGSGLFTEALLRLKTEGQVIAADKSPHMLWRLKSPAEVRLQVEEIDFTESFLFPQCDGMVMANALHYAKDPLQVLRNVLEHLKPGGHFILIEYDLDSPRPPWIPYPVSFPFWKKLAKEAGLSEPVRVGEKVSRFGHSSIYGAYQSTP